MFATMYRERYIILENRREEVFGLPWFFASLHWIKILVQIEVCVITDYYLRKRGPASY
jgi:hypothetical protein